MGCVFLNKPLSQVETMGKMVIKGGESWVVEDDGYFSDATMYFGDASEGVVYALDSKIKKPEDVVRSMGWRKKRKEKVFKGAKVVTVQKTTVIEIVGGM
jgi:hypothetical protein